MDEWKRSQTQDRELMIGLFVFLKQHLEIHNIFLPAPENSKKIITDSQGC
jgi:hypothetical protein